jgi:hypothetical protein
MRRVFLLAMFVALCTALVSAQNYPKAEVFGGYQFARYDTENFNGWNASATANVNKWFGVAADFSGNYKTISGVSIKAHTYTFGPVFTARQNDRLQPFVHALFGGFHASASFGGLSGSTNGFAMAPGVGVDAVMNNRIAIRLVQADWVLLRAEGVTEKKNMRISTGIVFRF